MLWNGTHQGALALRDELKQFLWEELRLELSDEKTRVTHLTDGLNFLGFHLQWELPSDGHRPWLRVTPTKENLNRFRAKLKALTKRETTFITPEMRFKTLNRVIRGWGNYYRHVNFSHDASELDFWVNERVLIWLKHKHPPKGVRRILQRYKQREVTQRYHRWNFGVDSRTGGTIFIAKLQDIPLRVYRRRQRDNPYLTAGLVIPPAEPESPFVEPRVVNIPPETVEWEERRVQALKRDAYRCTHCGRTFVPLHIHHKIARRQGGTDELDNLQTLCSDCHQQTPTYGPPKRDESPRESRMT